MCSVEMAEKGIPYCEVVGHCTHCPVSLWVTQGQAGLGCEQPGQEENVPAYNKEWNEGT